MSITKSSGKTGETIYQDEAEFIASGLYDALRARSILKKEDGNKREGYSKKISIKQEGDRAKEDQAKEVYDEAPPCEPTEKFTVDLSKVKPEPPDEQELGDFQTHFKKSNETLAKVKTMEHQHRTLKREEAVLTASLPSCLDKGKYITTTKTSHTSSLILHKGQSKIALQSMALLDQKPDKCTLARKNEEKQVTGSKLTINNLTVGCRKPYKGIKFVKVERKEEPQREERHKICHFPEIRDEKGSNYPSEELLYSDQRRDRSIGPQHKIESSLSSKLSKTDMREKKISDPKQFKGEKCKIGAREISNLGLSNVVTDTVEVLDQGCFRTKTEILGSVTKHSLMQPEIRPSVSTLQGKSEVPIYLILPHAVRCKIDKCSSRECYIAKNFILHASNCYQQSKGGCQICIAMDTMVCRHAKVCSIPLHESCSVPSCNRVKVKILEQWMRLKVKHHELIQRVLSLQSHSKTCVGNCSYGYQCRSMKKLILHAKLCRKEGLCPTKMFLTELLENHKEACTAEACTLEECKKKIANNILDSSNTDLEENKSSADINTTNKPENHNEVSESQSTVSKRVSRATEGEAPIHTSRKSYSTLQAVDDDNDDLLGLPSTRSELYALTNETDLKDSYENFSFFANVYRPEASLMPLPSTITSEQRASKMGLEHLSVSSIPDDESKCSSLFSALCCKSEENELTLTAGENFKVTGEVIKRPCKQEQEHEPKPHQNEASLLSHARQSSEGTQNADIGYRLYSLWPDPSKSLPTFSPTEIQRILRVNTNQGLSLTMDEDSSDRIEHFLSTKENSELTLDGPLGTFSEVGRGSERLGYPKILKSLAPLGVLSTTRSETPLKPPQKKACARRLFPIDDSSDSLL